MRTPEQIAEEVERAAGRGLTAAAIFLSGRIKEVVSVPAPRKRVKTKRGGIAYRAATPATPGAPPRKLTGRLRASIGYEVAVDGKVARVGTNMIYARRLIATNHDFLTNVLALEAPNLAQIVGETLGNS
ncbi:hypothetical protein [Tuwongella immobilis]|uniref:HK97 gp10 family phage protein n=1 Tax=Tuwongella immobilis TaxID=692036 RepID=A0A6C2YRI6_9BACT|nr:hypothetical protein [Tuwongella immobilis]VIP03971.1 unnamed protein product [Tuwongella immobilis]VTS05309.1 unnamed protein product [Tuwongella immobilis]